MSAADELHKYCPICYHEKGGCNCEPVAQASGSARFSADQVSAWMNRNGYQGTISEARIAMEDAATLTPEQNS